eukprot:TRINITY_DN1995_c0_g1_i4.p1 TRINITY_DN1995_c0_g1~~TRINITY_DN1995_c0_g1_i4.p1  ORF type:complete len:112 (+),score=7.06 TRINITY_DN1995_c0_g1_i4:96-431(+)
MSLLGRLSARQGVLGRLVSSAPALAKPNVGATRALQTSAMRFGDYDWNLGVPGSRIRNPDPKNYDDVYPGMGAQWWTLWTIACATFFWGNLYDTTRPVNIAIGLFGPNMPL